MRTDVLPFANPGSPAEPSFFDSFTSVALGPLPGQMMVANQYHLQLISDASPAGQQQPGDAASATGTTAQGAPRPEQQQLATALAATLRSLQARLESGAMGNEEYVRALEALARLQVPVAGTAP